MRILFFTLILTNIIFAQINLGPFVGAVTENSATFIVKTYSDSQKVKIRYWEEKGVKMLNYSEEYLSVDSNFNYVKIFVTNLKPNTEYKYQAIINNYTPTRTHSFKTFPIEKNTNFSFAFGSCQQSGYAKWDPEVFPIVANDSIRFFIQIGDWTYPDSTEKRYKYRFNSRWDLLEKSYASKYDYNYPFSSEVISKVPIVYTYDDHDFAANNPDGTDSNKHKSILAYKKFFPHYKLENPENGIWQKFNFGDVDFFVLDLRSQRSSNDPSKVKKRSDLSDSVSMLAGFKITGENQLDWFLKSLKESKAKWKVIVSSVLFNPGYAKILDNDSITNKYKWLISDMVDKWAGFPSDLKALLNTIKENKIKNTFVITGDSHSSYIDDGKNSLIPEISASNLDVPNSFLHKKLEEGGINIWNQGTYDEDGHAYGKVSFFFGKENYALLQIINEKNEVKVEYKLKSND